MSTAHFISPLRYPGGKRKLAKYIKSIFRQNSFCDGEYAEPYAGGAAVALDLLTLEYARKIHINDIDPAIYHFWSSVVNHTEEFCRMISSTRVSLAAWHRQSEVLNNLKGHSSIEIGFATFYLNRTCRSGILNAGPIGGLTQDGKWTLGVRYNKQDLIARIEKIGMWSDAISIYNLDAIEFLKRMSKDLPVQSLVYLDPPYYNRGKELYRNFYDHDDHILIEKTLKKLKKLNWIVTYDDTEAIREIYSDYDTRPYFLTYTAQAKNTAGRELMVYGPGVIYDADEVPYSPRRKRQTDQ